MRKTQKVNVDPAVTSQATNKGDGQQPGKEIQNKKRDKKSHEADVLQKERGASLSEMRKTALVDREERDERPVTRDSQTSSKSKKKQFVNRDKKATANKAKKKSSRASSPKKRTKNEGSTEPPSKTDAKVNKNSKIKTKQSTSPKNTKRSNENSRNKEKRRPGSSKNSSVKAKKTAKFISVSVSPKNESEKSSSLEPSIVEAKDIAKETKIYIVVDEQDSDSWADVIPTDNHDTDSSTDHLHVDRYAVKSDQPDASIEDNEKKVEPSDTDHPETDPLALSSERSASISPFANFVSAFDRLKNKFYDTVSSTKTPDNKELLATEEKNENEIGSVFPTEKHPESGVEPSRTIPQVISVRSDDEGNFLNSSSQKKVNNGCVVDDLTVEGSEEASRKSIIASSPEESQDPVSSSAHAKKAAIARMLAIPYDSLIYGCDGVSVATSVRTKEEETEAKTTITAYSLGDRDDTLCKFYDDAMWECFDSVDAFAINGTKGLMRRSKKVKKNIDKSTTRIWKGIKGNREVTSANGEGSSMERVEQKQVVRNYAADKRDEIGQMSTGANSVVLAASSDSSDYQMTKHNADKYKPVMEETSLPGTNFEVTYHEAFIP